MPPIQIDKQVLGLSWETSVIGSLSRFLFDKVLNKGSQLFSSLFQTGKGMRTLPSETAFEGVDGPFSFVLIPNRHVIKLPSFHSQIPSNLFFLQVIPLRQP